VTFPDFPGF